MAIDRDLPDGQGTRLVAAQNVQAAEVLDGRELLDDHLLAGHPDRAARERHGHHHGEELGGQSHRQRDGEEKRLENVATQKRIDKEHKEDEEYHHLQDQKAEPARAALEFGLGDASHQPGRNLAEFGGGPGGHHHGDSQAAHHRGPAEDCHGFRPRVGRRRRSLRLFLARERLAGEQRLVHEQISRGDQASVRGHQVARLQVDHVAHHRLPHRDLALLAIAEHGGHLGDLPSQPRGRRLRPVGLAEVQGHAQHDHQDDHRRADALTEGGRHRAGHQQDQDERIGQLMQQLAHGREPRRRRDLIGSVCSEARGRLGGGQASNCAPRAGQSLMELRRPRARLAHLASSSVARRDEDVDHLPEIRQLPALEADLRLADLARQLRVPEHVADPAGEISSAVGRGQHSPLRAPEQEFTARSDDRIHVLTQVANVDRPPGRGDECRRAST
jgi:hypothetical protein